MKQRIYIKAAALDLECSERTFRRWCSENGVAILIDKGLKKHYVCREEYEYAKFRVTSDYLFSKYGSETSIDAVSSYMNFHAQLRIAVIGGQPKSYKPLGEQEVRFLSSLTIDESGI